MDVSSAQPLTRPGAWWTNVAHGRGRTIALVAAAIAIPTLALTGAVVEGRRDHSSAPAVAAPVTTPAATSTPAPSPAAAPTPSATPTPTPTTPPPAPVPAAAGRAASPPAPPSPPRYPTVFQFDAPSVGVDVPVVSVGLDSQRAMEAPEGPLGSAFWREGFWLRYGAVPGNPGTATIAGHLDDTAGRPAAFWNIRGIQTGAEVSVTRLSDGAVLKYRVVETDVWTDSQASTPDNLRRIYGDGTAGDGVARLTLITCTGRWVNGHYDHRFVAFAQLES
jgi:sortase family protein